GGERECKLLPSCRAVQIDPNSIRPVEVEHIGLGGEEATHQLGMCRDCRGLLLQIELGVGVPTSASSGDLSIDDQSGRVFRVLGRISEYSTNLLDDGPVVLQRLEEGEDFETRVI